MKQRKWIDLVLFYTTIILIFSGIVLYIVPPGRVAYFTGWTFLGLDKDNWGNLHIIFAIVMAIFVAWHLIVNWSALKRYLITLESLLILIIVIFISAGTIVQIQPFRTVSDLQNKIQNSWKENKVNIPIPHAEKLTLQQLCEKLDIDLKETKLKLQQHNIHFNENQTLLKIAKNNSTTPAKIYDIISNQSNTQKTVKHRK